MALLTVLSCGVGRFSAAALNTINVTLSNTALPVDNSGQLLKTGEINLFVDPAAQSGGYVYLYVSDWGCVRQVSCCTNAGAWPSNDCWTCCPAQRAAAYRLNHTIRGYRTRDFSTYENLGVLVGVDDRAEGTVFVPRVLYNPTTALYVMWFENYSGSKTPVGGEYSIALSARPDRDWVVRFDRPHNSARFACGTSQGDFDLFVDPAQPDVAYIVNTYYDHFCIEELDRTFTGGTGKTANVTAMDPTIASHPPGDEAPTVFKRGSWWYLTYASGCCGCVGGSVVWQHRARHPLGPWEQVGKLLTPSGPVTLAQQRSVFKVPSADHPWASARSDAAVGASTASDAAVDHNDATQWTYVHVGNQWGSSPRGRTVQGGVEGTCENNGLLYWWVLDFDANGSIVPRTAFARDASFEIALPPLSACDALVPLPQQCNESSAPPLQLDSANAWTLYTNLSDPSSHFSASALVANISSACKGVTITLGDTKSAAFRSAGGQFFALGAPSVDGALRAKAAAWGVAPSPAPAGVAEGYTLRVANAPSASAAPSVSSTKSRAVFLLGDDAPGSFYAVQTFLQLVSSSSAQCAIPALSIADYPDLPLRGGEFESTFDGNQVRDRCGHTASLYYCYVALPYVRCRLLTTRLLLSHHSLLSFSLSVV